VHYVPAARILATFDHITNREHPLLGKELIALGIALFGDHPWSWRVLPAIAGIATLFAFMRGMWFASLSRFATIASGILLSTGFILFIQSRIAMLDIFMVAFAILALWMVAGAARMPGQARWRLILAGLFLGLEQGCKWNAAPVLMGPGPAFLFIRL